MNVLLSYDGDDLMYRDVTISPWIYQNDMSIYYQLTDNIRQQSLCNVDDLHDAIVKIDQYRDNIPDDLRDFNKFVVRLRKEFNDKKLRGQKLETIYNDGFVQLELVNKHYRLYASNSHDIDREGAVRNRANGMIVISTDKNYYWNCNGNTTFNIPTTTEEIDNIIEYLKSIGKNESS